jgi:hypothetical protein
MKGGSYGHVMIAIGKSTNDKALSNDYVRRGKIDKATPRDLPRWGLQVVGYSFWTPYGELDPRSSSDYWDGTVPDYDNCMAAWEDKSLASKAAWRIACRLADWGFYGGAPQANGIQKYPVKAVSSYQKAKGFSVPEPGQYGPRLHEQLWGVKP